MKHLKHLASVDILYFMYDNMKTLASGQSSIASIPTARFSKSFPIKDYVIDLSNQYVSMVVTRGEMTPDEVEELHQGSSHMFIAVFEDEIKVDSIVAIAGDVILLKRGNEFRPSDKTLWGFVPFGYAIHLRT